MILALDTSTEAFSIALQLQNKTIVEQYKLAPRQHSKIILSAIETLLKDNNVNKTDLTAIVFGKGPGGFTGVRIAVSVAQGLSVGLNLPIVGISTLASMAQYVYRTLGHKYIACAIDARMNEVYWGQYIIKNNLVTLQTTEAVLPPNKVTLNDNNNVYVGAGSGWEAYKKELTKALNINNIEVISNVFPHAHDMITLANITLAKNHHNLTVNNAMPTYLRDNVAKTIKEREQNKTV